jgi:hypothetical protein
MSIGRKSTFFLGIFIFLIPFFGLPTLWKMILTGACGALLALLSVSLEIPKRTAAKHKPRKEKPAMISVEPVPAPVIYPRNDTIEAAAVVPLPPPKAEAAESAPIEMQSPPAPKKRARKAAPKASGKL